MDSYEVHGLDVSHYQSYINWDQVALSPVHFVFVKATEGLTMTDTLFCHNWYELERVGLKRGAYHFYRPTIGAREQAVNFLNAVEMKLGDMPPVLDIEVTDGVKSDRIIDSLKVWLREVEAGVGLRPIIYTNLKFYHQHLAGHFIEYPVWIARYHYQKPFLDPGKDWDFWQYGNRGEIAGIKGDVDFNVFRGTFPELEEMCMQPPPTLSSR
ncbi:MAG TPA: GH25 family lysozyme [Saprospiraceae bacterium]|nr:GH25 family lysozyme [Saprospiraceae bacterium]